MTSTPKTFVFIGRSGCGKGTQVELLAKKIKELEGADALPVLHLESGERFRAFIKSGTFSGELSRVIYEEGELHPSFLSIWMWSSLMIDNVTGNEHIILDGIPRREVEVRVLDSAFKFYKRDTAGEIVIVYLDISHDEAVKRMKARHRSDDLPANIEKRMSWFETEVMPAIDVFRSLPGYKVLDINGEGSVEDIHADIVSKAGLV
jgi:adenylate kinase family enzyme